mgnify:CR=1 FL=1
MLRWLPSPLKGILSLLLYIVNTLFWFIPLMLLAILKLLPITRWQAWMSYLVDAVAVAWISLNNFTTHIFTSIKWRVEGLETLSRKDWYLIIANHQSWADILILQNIFYRKIPFIKFFLKKELLYVPFMGLCWWALDFPFMKRYSTAQLAKRPELKGKDIATTRASCQKFKTIPTTIINFVEGTRFTDRKKTAKHSPFQHLLPPKAGGIAFTLASMGEQFNAILDFTLLYPDNPQHVAMDMLMGKLKRVVVQVEVLQVDQQVIGDYFNDEQFRERFQLWLNQRWQHKDQLIQQYHQAQVLATAPDQLPC